MKWMMVETLVCWRGGRLGHVGKCLFEQKKIKTNGSINIETYGSGLKETKIRGGSKSSIIQELEEALDEQRASNGANTKKSHFGVAVQGWRWLQPSRQFLVVVLAGGGAPCALPPAPRVSPGEVTRSGVTDGCCMLPKWPTVCP